MKVPFPNNEKTRSDISYRYKRDTLVTVSNGQFILIKNIIDIAKDLDIDIGILIKYLQKKSGQPFIFDKSSNTYKIKNGSNNLEKYLEQFIVENLVCGRCSLPEVKNTKICASCGMKHA